MASRVSKYAAISKYNRGHRYILTLVDVLFMNAWVVAVKDKLGTEVLKTFF